MTHAARHAPCLLSLLSLVLYAHKIKMGISIFFLFLKMSVSLQGLLCLLCVADEGAHHKWTLGQMLLPLYKVMVYMLTRPELPYT